MKRIWINIAHSFKEAEEFDRNYYAQMTPEERLSIVQELREMHFKFAKVRLRRLRRVIKIIDKKQDQSLTNFVNKIFYDSFEKGR